MCYEQTLIIMNNSVFIHAVKSS